MRNIHTDMPNLRVGLMGHQHLLRRLDEIEIFKSAGVKRELWNFAGQAVCTRANAKLFRQQFVSGPRQRMGHPRFQIGVTDIGEPHRRSSRRAELIGRDLHDGMCGVQCDRSGLLRPHALRAAAGQTSGNGGRKLPRGNSKLRHPLTH